MLLFIIFLFAFDSMATGIGIGSGYFSEANPLICYLINSYGLWTTMFAIFVFKLLMLMLILILLPNSDPAMRIVSLRLIAVCYTIFSFLPWLVGLLGLL